MAAQQGGIEAGRPCVPRFTYETPPGVVNAQGLLTSGGFEPNSRLIEVSGHQRPRVFLTSLYVYLAAAAGAPMFVQVYDGSFRTDPVTNQNVAQGDVPPAGAGDAWNPRFIEQVNPGQLFTWEPPPEGQAELNWGDQCTGSGWRSYHDDYGFPFELGIILAISTIDNGYVKSADNIVRVMARVRDVTKGAENA
jgi:hypothetical protein